MNIASYDPETVWLQYRRDQLRQQISEVSREWKRLSLQSTLPHWHPEHPNAEELDRLDNLQDDLEEKLYSL